MRRWLGSGAPSGCRLNWPVVRADLAAKPVKPLIHKIASIPFDLVHERIDASLSKSSRSRCARRASSSASLGTANHRTHARLARAAIASQRPQEHIPRSNHIRFRRSRSAIHLQDRSSASHILNSASLQKAPQRKAVAVAPHRSISISKIGLPAANERAFNRSIIATSAAPIGSITCRVCFFQSGGSTARTYLFRTQLQSFDHRAIAVQRRRSRAANLQNYASYPFSKRSTNQTPDLTNPEAAARPRRNLWQSCPPMAMPPATVCTARAISVAGGQIRMSANGGVAFTEAAIASISPSCDAKPFHLPVSDDQRPHGLSTGSGANSKRKAYWPTFGQALADRRGVLSRVIGRAERPCCLLLLTSLVRPTQEITSFFGDILQLSEALVRSCTLDCGHALCLKRPSLVGSRWTYRRDCLRRVPHADRD